MRRVAGGGMLVLDGFPNEAEYGIDARSWIVGPKSIPIYLFE